MWITAGLLFLGVAYVGVIVPGIPWSTPTVAAAYCFARGSDRWHNWIMNHKLFGPFLRNWSEKRVFPLAGKWAMVATMDVSLIVIWVTTQNWKLVLSIGLGMLVCGVWAWRYPHSVQEYQRRKDAGEKIGWFQ